MDTLFRIAACLAILSLVPAHAGEVYKCKLSGGGYSYQGTPCPKFAIGESIDTGSYSYVPSRMTAVDQLKRMKEISGRGKPKVVHVPVASAPVVVEAPRTVKKTLSWSERKQIDSNNWKIRRAAQKGQHELIPALERENAAIRGQVYLPSHKTEVIHNHRWP